MSQNRNWKEDFDTRFNPRDSVPSEIRILAKAFLGDIKSFIEEVISDREKEIAEDVEKKSFRGFAPYEQHYLIKKGDVLSILKYK